MAHLIREAYDIEDNQIVSAPEWTLRTSGERFDITARFDQVPGGGDAGHDRAVQAALRTLLAERFNLVVRRETREAPMYALVMARRDGQPGPMLKRVPLDCRTPEGRKAREARVAAGQGPGVCGMRVRTGLMEVGGYTMADFARGLSPYNGRSVLDRTGLTGIWAFELRFMPDEPPPPPQPGREPPPPIDPNAPPLLTAMQEQLGLKLEPTRGTTEVLIVERVERPTEN